MELGFLCRGFQIVVAFLLCRDSFFFFFCFRTYFGFFREKRICYCFMDFLFYWGDFCFCFFYFFIFCALCRFFCEKRKRKAVSKEKAKGCVEKGEKKKEKKKQERRIFFFFGDFLVVFRSVIRDSPRMSSWF